MNLKSVHYYATRKANRDFSLALHGLWILERSAHNMWRPLAEPGYLQGPRWRMVRLLGTVCLVHLVLSHSVGTGETNGAKHGPGELFMQGHPSGVPDYRL